MRVTVSGASGLIGSRLVQALRGRGDEVTTLSRDPARGVRWDLTERAPTEALNGRDAVIHLAGENVAQRWSPEARKRIRESRELGTHNLVRGIEQADARPTILVCASAVGYYGSAGDERLTEDAPAGDDFLAQVCVAWENEAQRAEALGLRVVRVRTGVMLDSGGGALGKMLLPFKLGAGGPVAGGHQYMPWIHADDVAGLYLAALDDERYSGPVNASAPEPVTNQAFSKALGRALHRPAVAPIPGFAIRALYGDMAEIVTEGQRAVPAKALALGYPFQHPDLDEALRAAIG